MKKISRRSFLQIAATTTIAGAFVACGNDSASTDTSTSTSTSTATTTEATSNVSAKGVLPIVSTPLELNVLLSKNATISDYDDNDFYNWVEEQTGIRMKITAISSSDLTQKINLMLSSGQDMPDIFLNCLASDVVSTYSDKDVFVDLNPYIETQGDYLGAFYENTPTFLESIQVPDGRTLALPVVYPAGTDMTIAKHSDIGGKLWVNQNWLDDLGMGLPTNTDEFYAMLSAFASTTLNGDSSVAQIPLIGAASGGWDSLPEIFLCNAFLPYSLDQPYYIDGSGNIQASYAQEEYREALKYMNTLVNDGLLDPVTYTQDNAQLKQLAEMDPTVVGSFASAASSMALTTGTELFESYVAVPPLEGPNGVQLTTSRLWTISTSNTTAITTSCSNIEAAFKLLDFLHTEEAALRTKYGVPDVHWKYAEEGEIAINGEPALFETLISLYTGDTTNARSGVNFGDSGRFQNYAVRSDDPYESERYFLSESQKYFPYAPTLEQSVLTYFYSADDSKEMSEVNGTLTTYVDEARTKFILGVFDINDDATWENYLSEIDAIGYKTVIEIMQARHDSAK